MTARPGTIDKCKNCITKKQGGVCPDSCGIYQDLTADYEYERMMEDREDEENETTEKMVNG